MTSFTETFDLSRDDLADLALPVELDERLRNALDGDDRHEIEAEINEAVTAQIQEHGVSTDTGEWYGDWSARDIVAGVLVRHGV